jgi:hypothetical protein
VFCRCIFYAKDEKLKSAAYNAVILLSRTSCRFRKIQRMHAHRPDSVQLCNVGVTWLNNVHGSWRGDVRPTGTDVTLATVIIYNSKNTSQSKNSAYTRRIKRLN